MHILTRPPGRAVAPPYPRAHFDHDGNLLVSVPWPIARRALDALRTVCPGLEVTAAANPLYGASPEAVVAVLSAERHLRQRVEAVR